MSLKSLLLGVCAFTLGIEGSPQNPEVLHGSASFNEAGMLLQIEASDKAIIQWKNFGIKSGETVSFSLPSQHAAVLNRDIGGIPSEILGSLLSNGKVFIINKAGVILGKDAIVDTSSFVASSLDVLNEAFIRGDDLIFTEGDGSIINYGTIQTKEGSIVLIGRSVSQEGTLKAQSTHIGAGREVLLKQEGVERIFIRPQQPSSSIEKTGISQLGFIESLSTELKCDGTLYELAIQHDGKINSPDLIQENGRILLVADKGRIDVNGLLSAPGGSITVMGKHNNVEGTIDASSDFSGGTILIGGEFQGKNSPYTNAELTRVGETAEIKANSHVKGNGGRVILWADGGTQFLGSISANAGSQGGDGGFVEVSGRFGLDYRGKTSTFSPLGTTGTLLLDPSTITINAGPSAPAFTFPIYNPAVAAATIAVADITGNIGASNITILTSAGSGGTGDIHIEDQISYSSTNSLTLTADGVIYVGAPITNSSNGNINLNAASDIVIGKSDSVTFSSQDVNVSSFSGQTNLSSTAGSILVGDSGSSFSCQIGWMASAAGNITGPISVIASQDVTVKAGDVAATVIPYSQIGHGARTGTNNGLNSNISVTASNGNIQLLGSNAASLTGGGFALIGHGSYDNTNNGNNISGDITVSAPNGTLSLQSGTAQLFSFTQIGHCGAGNPGGTSSNNGTMIGDINVTADGAITLTANAENHGFAHIGHGGANYRFVDNVHGDITITKTSTGNITLQAGNGNTCYAQIGHGGRSMLCSSTVTGHQILGNIIIAATSSDNLVLNAAQDASSLADLIYNYAQIGHGGALTSTEDNQGIWLGNITIDNDKNIFLRGGNREGNYAQIGTGGYQTAPNSLQGDIGLTAPNGGLLLSSLNGPAGVDSGLGAYTQIGHGGAGVFVGNDLTIAGSSTGSVAGNINIQALNLIALDGGGVAPVLNGNQNAPAQIGHGGADYVYTFLSPAGAIFQGNITVQNDASDITLIGGQGDLNGGAWIGHGQLGAQTVPTFFTGSVSITSLTGKVTLTGGTTGSNVVSVIGNGLNRTVASWTYAGNQSVSCLNNIAISGDTGAGSYASISSRSGTQTIQTSQGNIILQAGDGTGAHASIVSDGTQTITAFGSIGALGGTGAAQTFSYVTNLSGTSLTTMNAQTGSVLFHNGSAVNRPSMIHSSTFPLAFTGASIAINAGRDIELCADIDVSAQPASTIFLRANTIGDGLGSYQVNTGIYNNLGIQIGPSTYGIAFDSFNGNITILATDRFANSSLADFMIGDTNDLSLAPLMPMTIGSLNGDVTINHYRDILLTSGNQGGLQGRNVLVIADRNMQMTELPGNPSKITSTFATLVVDNYFPTPPGIGPGFFSMTPNATIIRDTQIFSARQPLNSILGTINGVNYVAGPEFADTNRERWGVYYPDPFFGGPQYTIFYKNLLTVPFDPLTPQLVYEAQSANSEMFYDLREYDDKMFWRTFLVTYARDKYLEQKETQATFSQWAALFQKYQILNWWHGMFKEIPALDSLSSYEVGYNREFVLQPRLKGFRK